MDYCCRNAACSRNAIAASTCLRALQQSKPAGVRCRHHGDATQSGYLYELSDLCEACTNSDDAVWIVVAFRSDKVVASLTTDIVPSPLVYITASPRARWVVSADAVAAVAMCGILVTTLELWKANSTSRFVCSGIAWGLAIGTKFTFGPLYLLFIPLFHVCSYRKRDSSDSAHVSIQLPRSLAWYAGQWILHGLVACVTLHTMYCFRGVGVPIGQHDFTSQAFNHLRADPKVENGLSVIKNWIVALPSPFPKVFLEGVDQQMADMDYPRGAYWMGDRIPGKIRWFHFAGYFVKEQMTVWAAIGLACIGWFIRRLRSIPVEGPCHRCIMQFCFLYLCGFSLFMMTQCNLVWNIRYLTPMLPLIYVLLAATLPAISIALPFGGKRQCSDTVVFRIGRHCSYGIRMDISPLFFLREPIVWRFSSHSDGAQRQ